MSNLVRVEFDARDATRIVYIATPATTLHSNYLLTLVRQLPELANLGVSFTYALLDGHCHVDDARNLLVADFLKTNCTDLIFLDADVGSQQDGIWRLLQTEGDIVGGAYPLKDGSGKFPVKFDARGQCIGLPTGFMRIKRRVLTTLAKTAQTLKLDGMEAPIIFERGSMYGERIGGDYNFCLKARDKGFSLTLVRGLLFTHSGMVDFPGRLPEQLSEVA
jgi:hypothetical protein